MNCRFLRVFLSFASVALCAVSLKAQTAEWLWDSKNNDSSGNQVRYFRKVIDVPHSFVRAELVTTADDKGEVFINGQLVATIKDWKEPVVVDVTKHLHEGSNVISARIENAGAKAGFIARLQTVHPTLGSDRQKYSAAQHAGLRWINVYVTDTSWTVSSEEPADWKKVKFDDHEWKHATSVGKLGDKPWGNVFMPPSATAAESIKVMPGFKVELLRSAGITEGSWVSMTIDPAGRLIVSPQYENHLLRFTIKGGKVAKVETIEQPIGEAMGLLYAKNSLFVNGKGPNGLGIYRMMERADSYDAPVLIRPIEKAEGEHGSHAVLLGPDERLYVVNGNFTKRPTDQSPDSPMFNYADDQLLPRANDGNGFGMGVLPPGGFVMRMDLDGRNPELFAAGMRNTYDIAFNNEGELFGFDSDMEWDWGTPWYRPTRIAHIVSGGDYGFREGTGKFPPYYQDTLPPIKNIGLGSPTGIKFGYASNFPEKYRNALFLLDWSYGRIMMAYLKPDGSTYTGEVETLLRGKPLNVTDVEFGNDGAMYFLSGGRHTQAGLYRVTYVGKKLKSKETTEELANAARARQARELRHKLETFQGRRVPGAVDFAWPHLASNDRFIRFAARIAIESQEVSSWKDRALNETNVNAGLTALLALARSGEVDTQTPLLKALRKFPIDTLNDEQEMLKLRVIEVSFARQGRPQPEMQQLAIEKLNPHYPAKNELLNREYCQLLLYLGAPDAISKTLSLLQKAPTQEEQIYYVLRLRTITNGWTLDQRKQYFTWFNNDRSKLGHDAEVLKFFADVERDYSDGSSFPKFMEDFRNEAIGTLTPEDKLALTPVLPKEETNKAVTITPHKFVQAWKLQDLLSSTEFLNRGRSFKKGKEAFAAAQCAQCHRFGNAGGAVGPELTAVASRLAARDILESIIEPSKVVSEQFQNTTLFLKDGDDVTGRIVAEDDNKIVVITDALKQTKKEVKKADVQERRASKLSPMPEGLVNVLTRDEILDLVAYLQSAGKPKFHAFKK
ncbi:MAG: heme-binding protein [Verrucomicrobiales bacterium]|nr:heme-binding protein [Verrucomicrobiales bacterium]